MYTSCHSPSILSDVESGVVGFCSSSSFESAPIWAAVATSAASPFCVPRASWTIDRWMHRAVVGAVVAAWQPQAAVSARTTAAERMAALREVVRRYARLTTSRATISRHSRQPVWSGAPAIHCSDPRRGAVGLQRVHAHRAELRREALLHGLARERQPGRLEERLCVCERRRARAEGARGVGARARDAAAERMSAARTPHARSEWRPSVRATRGRRGGQPRVTCGVASPVRAPVRHRARAPCTPCWCASLSGRPRRQCTCLPPPGFKKRGGARRLS